MTFDRLPLRLAALAVAGLTLAACETTGSGPQASVAAAPAQPMTHTQAAMECWMGTEKNDGRINLDKRADIVDRCIEQKMKGAPAPKG